MYRIKSNVFPEGFYKSVKEIAKATNYRPVKTETGEYLFLGKIPSFIRSALLLEVETLVGKSLKEIATFYRLNTSIHDTEFRIHCDSEINGEKPTYACVFYLHKSKESGTALYSHESHGLRARDKVVIFDSDDGLWEPWRKILAEENKLFVYEADLFHGRFPWKCWGSSKQDGRLVIVGFFKEV